jgi:bis(5'-nucleosidyl)-tetraphosphatase
MADTNTEMSAGFIVFRNEGDGEGRKRFYLLLHYATGHWDYVKGHIEAGENEAEAALREAKEEAGLADLKILEGFREKITYHFKRAGRFITKEVIFFVAETGQKEVKLSFEHTGCKWLEYDDAMQQITYDSSKEILKKAHRFIDEYGRQKRLDSF